MNDYYLIINYLNKLEMSKIQNAINLVRNTVNSICSNIGLSQNFRRLENTMAIYDNFLGRPIGIVGKNYNFIKSTLQRNIGSGSYGFDGYGTPISSLADPYYNLNTDPWFYYDSKKKIYSNYIDYINGVFFDGFMDMPNFSSQEEKAAYFDYNSLLLENNKIGVIRNYDIFDNTLSSKLLANGVQTNPNTYTDSRLGIVNNFYLSATLQNSYSYENKRNDHITDNVYKTFGFTGELGMVNGEFTLSDEKVIPQNALTDQFILYTPFDGDFGSVDNTISSNDLINSSNYKTQQFIYKSLLGYDLLTSNEVPFSDNDATDYSYITNKKYSPRKNQDYLSKFGSIIGYDVNSDDEIIRYNISEKGNGHSTTEHIIYTYAETEGNKNGSVFTGTLGNTWNDGTYYGSYSTYTQIFDAYGEKKDIISYTNKCFELGKYDTLIGRFHTNEYSSNKDAKVFKDMLSSAISKYGMSHGRNLLKKEPEKDNNVNGYTDPYCRVWTFHKQYSKLENLIRPLYNNDKLDQTIITEYQFNRSRLENYGVKDKTNKLVKITPNRSDSSIKNCMFSIENLAWKYETNGFNGHEDQKGPLGGRIMWFPPYGLSFSENVNVGWNPTQFIGRGENIYTYINTERSGNLSFKLLIDHPSLLNNWREGGGENGSVDDVDSMEQKILRFFAGCEILEQKKEEQKPKSVTKPKIPSEPKKSPIYVKHKESSSVYFYVFFPNDYSGIDDSANGKVKPIDYIANGILCQKDVNGNDIGTSYSFNGAGYEMGKSNGISSGITSSGSVTINNTTFGTYEYTNKNGKKNNWGYRVDKSYANEVFRNSNSYYDTTDYGLNSTGYDQLLQYHTDAKSITDNNGILISFADILYSLDDTSKDSLNGLYSESNVQIFKQLLDEYDILSVEVNGYASSHGYVSNNNDLNHNRAQTVINWLNKCDSNKFPKSKCSIKETGIGSKLNHNNASSIDAKVWRCVKVVINFEKEELIEQQSSTIQNDDVTKVGISNNDNKNLNSELTNIGEASTNSEIQYKLNEASDKLTEANDNSDFSSSTASESKGYGDEYKFFDQIVKENPFLHNKIVDKIKYFDPAYHSITPEGFNARLTFLHQCTRQGNTSSASDTAFNRTASNLSFGAPPICVLRIGDFYNTKIIIDSLQINFEETTWDLNDEGIGVMPMIADISISFKFLGGSDLSGPITRLQNAVSFNYYANTTVYDDRSELVEYDENGNIISFKSQQ